MELDLSTRPEREAYSEEKHYRGALCKRGHDAGNGQSWRHKGHGNCVECCRLGAREWRKANPDRAKASTNRRDQKTGKRWTRSSYPIATLVGNARGRARACDLPFSLTSDDMKMLWRHQEGRCFWTARALDFFVGEARHPMRPSLDRLEPARGYVAGNVVWSSNFANRARGELSAHAFSELMVSMGFPQPDFKLVGG